jgi:MFS family permease
VYHHIFTATLAVLIAGFGSFWATCSHWFVPFDPEVGETKLTIMQACVCPFVGSLSDIVGRRWVAISGAAFIVVGMIICSVANTMNTFICGMVG